MRLKSPVMAWREARGMSRSQLAQPCDLDESTVMQVEAGRDGLPGEL